jgi:uncharacterized protein
MRIHLPSYLPGVHRIAESVQPSDIDLDIEIFSNPIETNLVLDRHDPYLQVKFIAECRIRLECDRCLTSYDYLLTIDAPMLYVLGRSPGDGEVDDPGISYLPASTVDLDVSRDLRDFVILALPERHLCKEECLGLCPNCGVDLNVETCQCRQD